MTRELVRSVLALILLAVAGLIGWRVLGPAEVLAPATDPYPEAVRRGPGAVAELVSPPLIVDGRIRVYAAKRQVKADAPVTAKTMYTPRWSFRRWPQQVSGVVAAGSTVVSRWSDGELVAIDGRTGQIAWRVDGPAAGGYADAETVWAPPGMFTAGRTLLIVAGHRVRAFDTGSGAPRWQADCRTGGFATAGGQFICGEVVHDAATGAVLHGWPSGPFTAVGCGVAESGCGGLRDSAGKGWLTPGAIPRRAAGLDVPGSTVYRNLALTTGDAVVARSPESGGELWRWAVSGAIVLGAGRDVIYLLTADRQLVALDAATGRVRARFPIAADGEPGLWQVTSGYVAMALGESYLLAAI